ncbi:hypothetical protein IQ13_0574 [Lacibacter cauensis]|uniref:Uncharacterized protein n=1 Tax=Lacibacter cauensis TaxID=510947 RepID=A0A562SW67_9BACT|nr:hypothetical protein IQ13_0574 [Lacibacter cauensis]
MEGEVGFVIFARSGKEEGRKYDHEQLFNIVLLYKGATPMRLTGFLLPVTKTENNKL